MEPESVIAGRRDQSMLGVSSAIAPQSSEIDFSQRNSFKQSKQFAQQEFVKFY